MGVAFGRGQSKMAKNYQKGSNFEISNKKLTNIFVTFK